MTESELRNKVVETIRGFIGLKEADGSHMQIVNLYNGHSPLARNYKVKSTDSWCAATVSAVSIKLGLTDIMPTECSCGRMVELYKALGRWEENDAYIPAPGDIIMYDWQDSGNGDCTGWPDHVGIVAECNGTTMKVIEGNKADAVGTRIIAVNGRYIRGYCLPDYASKSASAATQPAQNTATAEPARSTPTTAEKPAQPAQESTQRTKTREFQKWLSSGYGCSISADGLWGPKTNAAAIKALQTELNSQFGKGLKVDGIWGTKTRQACVTVKRGAKGNLTRIVQGTLYAIGYDPNGFDGAFGAGCEASVKSFQRDNGLSDDGQCGKATFAALLG